MNNQQGDGPSSDVTMGRMVRPMSLRKVNTSGPSSIASGGSQAAAVGEMKALRVTMRSPHILKANAVVSSFVYNIVPVATHRFIT